MTVIKRKLRSRSSGKHRVVLGGIIVFVGYLAWTRPSKDSGPLCQECWEIVRSMPRIDIRYEDVSHMEGRPGMLVGARNDQGDLESFYFDETALHSNPERFDVPFERLGEFCDERGDDYRMFEEKIFVDSEYDQKAREREYRPKILCIVYLFEEDHSNIPAVRQTWGSKCDGFVVLSDKTDLSIGAIGIPHEGQEDYANRWQIVQGAWTFIYDNYYQSYDWFFLAQPDSFFLIENLRYYLESEEIRVAEKGGRSSPDDNLQTPLYLGRRFALAGIQSEIFNGSGPGYILNKAALKSLIVDALPNLNQKLLHAVSSSHDTLLAQAFRTVGIRPYPTQDEAGGERFMPFLPRHHYRYRFPADKSNDWYAKWSLPGVKEGADHFAARSIGFHHASGDEMARLYVLAYGLCSLDLLEISHPLD